MYILYLLFNRISHTLMYIKRLHFVSCPESFFVVGSSSFQLRLFCILKFGMSFWIPCKVNLFSLEQFLEMSNRASSAKLFHSWVFLGDYFQSHAATERLSALFQLSQFTQRKIQFWHVPKIAPTHLPQWQLAGIAALLPDSGNCSALPIS